MTKHSQNILLAGVPRSGKTTVACRVALKLKISHIPLDALVSSFEEHFPEHGIVHHKLELPAICKNFLPFLDSFIREMKAEGARFCLDSYHVLPKGAALLAKKHNLRVVFLGFPSVPADEKLRQIKKFSGKNDWTNDLPDEHIKSLIQGFIEESKFIQTECARFKIPFIDSGTDFKGALDRAFKCATKGLL